MSADHDDMLLDATQAAAGRAVAMLQRPVAPKGLAARTLARVAATARRRIWILRPITNPLARCAAAAAILMLVVPLSDLEFAGKVGMGIERRVGTQLVNHVETLMDGVLPRGAPDGYSQSELEAFTEFQSNNKRAVRQVRNVKPGRV